VKHFIINRPYQRSLLCYSVASVVCRRPWRYVLWMAKRWVLEQNLLLTAYTEIRIGCEKSIGTSMNDLVKIYKCEVAGVSLLLCVIHFLS